MTSPNPKMTLKPVKDPDAHLDFGEDWGTGTTYDIVDKHGNPTGKTITADWLEAGEMITTSAWLVTGPDNSLTTSSPSVSVDGKTTTVWVDGGTVGQTYQLTNRVTTSAGRRDDRSIPLTITER